MVRFGGLQADLQMNFALVLSPDLPRQIPNREQVEILNCLLFPFQKADYPQRQNHRLSVSHTLHHR